MSKRIVILHDKTTNQDESFLTVSRLVRQAPKEMIGIGRGALYNALSKKGWYENKKVRIYYKKVDIQPEIWE